MTTKTERISACSPSTFIHTLRNSFFRRSRRRRRLLAGEVYLKRYGVFFFGPVALDDRSIYIFSVYHRLCNVHVERERETERTDARALTFNDL